MLKDVRGEEVDATVDDVTHKRAWLFHVMQDLRKRREVRQIMSLSENKQLDGEFFTGVLIPRVFPRFQRYSHNSWIVFCWTEKTKWEL